MDATQEQQQSRRLGPLTVALLVLGAGFGIGLTVLLAHSIQQGQRATVYPDSGAKPLLGLVIDSNLAVLSLDSGRAAERAGIRVGDVLHAVDGAPLDQASTVRQTLVGALARPHAAGMVQVSVERGRQARIFAVQTGLSATHTPSVTPTPDYDRSHYYL